MSELDELREQGGLAMLLALGLVMLYIAFRFQFMAFIINFFYIALTTRCSINFSAQILQPYKSFFAHLFR